MFGNEIGERSNSHQYISLNYSNVVTKMRPKSLAPMIHSPRPTSRQIAEGLNQNELTIGSIDTHTTSA
jgi:hypothetical protein